MQSKVLSFILVIALTCSFTADSPPAGTVIDKINGVNVYYNGAFDKTYGRNVSPDGYNLGLKYQCVEFIKRYYYEQFDHKMPDSYGHAVDFFDQSIKNDAAYNSKRGLYQYWNGNTTLPKVDNIVVFKTEGINIYGHIGIISKVSETEIEMVQQNYGTKSRITYPLKTILGRHYIDDKEVIGWLSFN